jgi:hypothetical protein
MSDVRSYLLPRAQMLDSQQVRYRDRGVCALPEYRTECSSKYPNRFVAWAGIDLSKPMDWCLEEIRRCVRMSGFRGISIEPTVSRDPTLRRPDERRLYPIYEECARLEVPINVTLSGVLQPQPGRPSATPFDVTPPGERQQRSTSPAGAFWQYRRDKLPHFLRAALLEAEENWISLGMLARQWTNIEPFNSVAWNALGLAYHRLGRNKDAEAAFAEARRMESRSRMRSDRAPPAAGTSHPPTPSAAFPVFNASTKHDDN